MLRSPLKALLMAFSAEKCVVMISLLWWSTLQLEHDNKTLRNYLIYSFSPEGHQRLCQQHFVPILPIWRSWRYTRISCLIKDGLLGISVWRKQRLWLVNYGAMIWGFWGFSPLKERLWRGPIFPHVPAIPPFTCKWARYNCWHSRFSWDWDVKRASALYE